MGTSQGRSEIFIADDNGYETLPGTWSSVTTLSSTCSSYRAHKFFLLQTIFHDNKSERKSPESQGRHPLFTLKGIVSIYNLASRADEGTYV